MIGSGQPQSSQTGASSRQARYHPALAGSFNLHPEYIRERISRIMAARISVRQEYGPRELFHFERLSPKQRDGLIDDILFIYAALLLDIGKMGEAFFGDPYKIVDNK
jgi:hypothetical protein